MRTFIIAAALAILATGAAAEPDPPACSPATAVKAICTCDVNTLRPLQGAIGLEQVRNDMAGIQSRPDHELKKLAKDPIKVVHGPDGGLFITDHHHGADAWRLTGRTSLICQVVQGPAVTEGQAFWDGLKQMRLVRLADADGKPITPAQLPKDLASMPDDPYRTLAGMVRRKNGFCRPPGQPEFAEFVWADWLRTRPELPVDEVRSSAAGQLDEALILVRSPDAKGVAGWIGDKPDGFTCPKEVP